MIPAGMNRLTDLIVRPGIEKRLDPLLLYKGGGGRGWAHRMWNGSLLMMACGAETLSDGVKLFNNPAFSQLCGPVRPPQKPSLQSWFHRLTDNPGVTRNIPEFTDYVRSLGLGDGLLTRVDRISDNPNCAPWRKYVGDRPRYDWVRERGIPKEEQLFYPFVLHDVKKADDASVLVKLVTSVVPMSLPEQLRADVCQDLIVALLSGDISPGQVQDRAAEIIRKNWKINSGQYEGGVKMASLDADVNHMVGWQYSEIV